MFQALVGRLQRRPSPDSLRIVTWNCRGALHRKLDALLELRPDVAIVQECAFPERWRDSRISCVSWNGNMARKGVAIITFGGGDLVPYISRENDIQYVVPAVVNSVREFGMLGVWTKKGVSGKSAYLGQLDLAIDEYNEFLKRSPCVVAGDLNSNANFYPAGKRNYHLEVVEKLSELGMVSAYHLYHGCKPGSEWHDTHRHNLGGTFHLDYCFIPTDWAPFLKRVRVGGKQWFDLSDHKPVIIDLSFPARPNQDPD